MDDNAGEVSTLVIGGDYAVRRTWEGGGDMWFALIDGEQELGPLDSSEVLDFYYKDIFSAETLLWREGLHNWVPLRSSKAASETDNK